MRPDIVPVILAGGEGRRLRPLTGASRPKPLLRPFSLHSLLQQTLINASVFAPPVIVCSHSFSKKIMDECSDVQVEPRAIIAEPFQRGTCAAIASAAFFLQKENPLMLVMPSDHMIASADIFQRAVYSGIEHISVDGLMIFGCPPVSAATRYGYIRTRQDGEIFRLEAFVEKPDPFQARALSKAPGVFWNTGIFLCRARVFLNLLLQHAPDIFNSVYAAFEQGETGEVFFYPDFDLYDAVPSMAVDYAVMEKLTSARVLPLETQWHDVGCWQRLIALKAGSIAKRFAASLK